MGGSREKIRLLALFAVALLAGAPLGATCNVSSVLSGAVNGSTVSAQTIYAARFNIYSIYTHGTAARVSLTGSVSGMVYAAIYTDSGTGPQYLVRQSSPQLAVAGTNSFAGLGGDLDPGNYYMAVFVESGTVMVPTGPSSNGLMLSGGCGGLFTTLFPSGAVSVPFAPDMVVTSCNAGGTSTQTASPSASASVTPSSTRTASITVTITPVDSGTFTQSITPSKTATATQTFCGACTATYTKTPCPACSPTSTFSYSPTATPTFSPSRTATPTKSPSHTSTLSVTSSFTETPSVSPTYIAGCVLWTLTPSGTMSGTPSASPTATPTDCVGCSPTESPTPSPTPTYTPTVNATPTCPWNAPGSMPFALVQGCAQPDLSVPATASFPYGGCEFYFNGPSGNGHVLANMGNPGVLVSANGGPLDLSMCHSLKLGYQIYAYGIGSPPPGVAHIKIGTSVLALDDYGNAPIPLSDFSGVNWSSFSGLQFFTQDPNNPYDYNTRVDIHLGPITFDCSCGNPSPTGTRTQSPGIVLTSTPTATVTDSWSPTGSPTPSDTATVTLTGTPSVTPTGTPCNCTATLTRTQSITPCACSFTQTPTPTWTLTVTKTGTPTETVGFTSSETPSMTESPGSLAPSPTIPVAPAGTSIVWPSPASGGVINFGFSMASAGSAKLQVLSSSGALLGEENAWFAAGPAVLNFDLTGYASGMYYYRITMAYDSGSSDSLPVKIFAVVP